MNSPLIYKKRIKNSFFLYFISFKGSYEQQKNGPLPGNTTSSSLVFTEISLYLQCANYTLIDFQFSKQLSQLWPSRYGKGTLKNLLLFTQSLFVQGKSLALLIVVFFVVVV